MHTIGFVKSNVTVNFDEKEIRKIINQYYIQSPYCNEINKAGEIVQKPELTKEHLDANYNACGNKIVEITAEILANGQLRIVNVC